MLKKVIGNRPGPPAYFDMSGKTFRIGDRAAAHVWLGDWRARNPERRIVVIEDNVSKNTEYSRYLPGLWLFGGIADELWTVSVSGEHVEKPEGDSLLHVSMWKIWKWLYYNKIFVPGIRSDPSAVISASEKLRSLKIPIPFISIQPLFDASYDKYRNSTPEWWRDVCSLLSSDFPVVVLGNIRNANQMKVPGKAYSLWSLGLNPMESLAVISAAKVHIGGMTGTTIWSAIFNVPTLAVYPRWSGHPKKGTDTRPIPFGAPVVYSQLGGDPYKLVGAAGELWAGAAESTPWG